VRPAKNIAVVSCMDARLAPARILGLEQGDAHVIRNAGGVITDAEIRSLAVSQHLLGTTDIMLVQHTDCGMLKITDEEFAELMEREAGEQPAWSAHTFDDLDESLRESKRRIEASPFIPSKRVRGFVYDVESGELREVT
jgi:carbonic anhydrase